MKKSVIMELLYEILMLSLSLIVGILVYVDFFVKISNRQQKVISNANSVILLIFTFDYFFRFFKAKNKIVFFKKNIIDLIAIIPFDISFRAVRLLRLTRILRVFRLIKAVPVIKNNISLIKGILYTNNLIKIIQFTILIIILSATGIVFFEDQMTNFFDAIWWAIVTASTVGYGDFFPITLPGRLIALTLMLTGIGAIGMLTGSIATFFLTENEEETDEVITLIQSRISKLKKLSEKEYKELLDLIELKRKS